MSLKIKSEHEGVIIGFNNDGKTPLGDRKDLDKLLMIAHSSRPEYLDYFENPPSAQQLKEAAGEEFIQEIKESSQPGKKEKNKIE
ncbi:hypothetical protein [Empedobacter falsenii]|uniref:hypothetical protein n=1 Tax=Empedobacter falsenii TaxID=343874 RepID=UPI003A80AE2F